MSNEALRAGFEEHCRLYGLDTQKTLTGFTSYTSHTTSVAWTAFKAGHAAGEAAGIKKERKRCTAACFDLYDEFNNQYINTGSTYDDGRVDGSEACLLAIRARQESEAGNG